MLQHCPCIYWNILNRVIDDFGIPMLPTRAMACCRLKMSESSMHETGSSEGSITDIHILGTFSLPLHSHQHSYRLCHAHSADRDGMQVKDVSGQKDFCLYAFWRSNQLAGNHGTAALEDPAALTFGRYKLGYSALPDLESSHHER